MLRATWPIRCDGVTYDTGADVSHLAADITASLVANGSATAWTATAVDPVTVSAPVPPVVETAPVAPKAKKAAR